MIECIAVRNKGMLPDTKPLTRLCLEKPLYVNANSNTTHQQHRPLHMPDTITAPPSTQLQSHTRQWLGQGHEVWLHPKLLIAPQLPSPAQAALHLVKHKQRPRLIAQRTQALRMGRSSDDGATAWGAQWVDGDTVDTRSWSRSTHVLRRVHQSTNAHQEPLYRSTSLRRVHQSTHVLRRVHQPTHAHQEPLYRSISAACNNMQ